MKTPTIALSLLLSATTVSLEACRSSHSSDSPQITPAAPTQGVVPKNEPAPTPAPAEAGFTTAELLTKYCTVHSVNDLSDSHGTKAPAGGPYLVSDVNQANDAYTLLFPKADGSYAAETVIGANNVSDPDCDLAKLTSATAVLLASMKIYATQDLKGAPACTYAPGNLTSYPDGLYAVESAYVVRLKGMAGDCAGLEQGYTDRDPNIVLLYAHPAE